MENVTKARGTPGGDLGTRACGDGGGEGVDLGTGVGSRAGSVYSGSLLSETELNEGEEGHGELDEDEDEDEDGGDGCPGCNWWMQPCCTLLAALRGMSGDEGNDGKLKCKSCDSFIRVWCLFSR